MENEIKLAMSEVMTTDDIAYDDVVDMGVVDDTTTVGIDYPSTDLMEEAPKAGISTQVILYIVIGVCAAVGIALGIVRGIKVAKK